MSADVDICNQALSRCGVPAIASLAEDSPLGDFCANNYPQKRDFLLGLYRWVFATREVMLTGVDNSTLNVAQMADFAFVKPSDIVGVVHAFRDQPSQRRGRLLSVSESDGRYWCNSGTVYAEYTALVDEGRWPSWFRELAIVAFAADVARYLQNTSMANGYDVKAFGTPSEDGQGGLMGLAMSADARAAPQRTLTGFDDGALVNVRGGGCGFDLSGPISFVDF